MLKHRQQMLLRNCKKKPGQRLQVAIKKEKATPLSPLKTEPKKNLLCPEIRGGYNAGSKQIFAASWHISVCTIQ